MCKKLCFLDSPDIKENGKGHIIAIRPTIVVWFFHCFCCCHSLNHAEIEVKLCFHRALKMKTLLAIEPRETMPFSLCHLNAVLLLLRACFASLCAMPMG